MFTFGEFSVKYGRHCIIISAAKLSIEEIVHNATDLGTENLREVLKCLASRLKNHILSTPGMETDCERTSESNDEYIELRKTVKKLKRSHVPAPLQIHNVYESLEIDENKQHSENITLTQKKI